MQLQHCYQWHLLLTSGPFTQLGAFSAIHTEYVHSALNPADNTSHGIYPTADLLLPVNLPPELQPFLVDSQLEPSPAKQCLLRAGAYLAIAGKLVASHPGTDSTCCIFADDAFREQHGTLVLSPDSHF